MPWPVHLADDKRTRYQVARGFGSNEIRGQFVAELLVRAKQVPEMQEPLAATGEAGGEEVRLQSVWRTRDGDGVSVDVCLRGLRSQSQRGWVGASAKALIGLDLDQAGQMEATFRELFKASPDAVVVADRFGSIVLVNRQAEKALRLRALGAHRSTRRAARAGAVSTLASAQAR